MDHALLLIELNKVENQFKRSAPVEFNSSWKQEVAATCGITPRNLLDCFFDVDGEPLVTRLRRLAMTAVERNVPIRFQ